jgi:hypothetical protein
VDESLTALIIFLQTWKKDIPRLVSFVNVPKLSVCPTIGRSCNKGFKAPTVFVQLFSDIGKYLGFVVATSIYCTVIAKTISCFTNGPLHGIGGEERRQFIFNR